MPSYVRKELRKRAGVHVDSVGQPVDAGQPRPPAPGDVDALLSTEPPVQEHQETAFRDTAEYRPSGNLVYNEKVLRDLQEGMPRPRPG